MVFFKVVIVFNNFEKFDETDLTNLLNGQFEKNLNNNYYFVIER